jgi:hypothetical protein
VIPSLERPFLPLESVTSGLERPSLPLEIATEPLEETLTPAAKKMILLSTILDWAEGGDFCGFALEDLPSGVGGTVVHHDDFVGNALEGKLKVQVLDGGGDAALLIPRGDDNREQRERSGGWVKAHSKLGKARRFFRVPARGRCRCRSRKCGHARLGDGFCIRYRTVGGGRVGGVGLRNF